MLGITMGAVIGTEIGAPEPVVVGDIADIQAKVGGCFDCVSIECKNTADGSMFTLVGYVHDEGRILNPPLEINIMASILFGKQLHGNCVILSGTNPETHESDGESYDLPSEFYDYLCKQLTKQLKQTVAFTMMLATAVAGAHTAKHITDDEYALVLSTMDSLGEDTIGGSLDTLPDAVQKILEKSLNFMVESMFNDNEDK